MCYLGKCLLGYLYLGNYFLEMYTLETVFQKKEFGKVSNMHLQEANNDNQFL